MPSISSIILSIHRPREINIRFCYIMTSLNAVIMYSADFFLVRVSMGRSYKLEQHMLVSYYNDLHKVTTIALKHSQVIIALDLYLQVLAPKQCHSLGWMVRDRSGSLSCPLPTQRAIAIHIYYNI